jgi:mono/diheme cytochrome c family protein
MGVLGALSRRDDLRDTSVSSQIAKQNEEVDAFMKAPFEPELAQSSLTAANRSLADPVAAKGKALYEQESCNACHGDDGIGTAAGAKLIGVAAKFSRQEIEALLKQPSTAMAQGGMTPVNLKEDDLMALIAYLESLK